MKVWSFWFMHPPMTWIMHGLVALALAVAGGVIATLLYPTPTGFALGYSAGAVCAAVFFNLKEQRDKARHVGRGTYDQSQPGAGVTSREDRIGDLVAPYSVAASALLMGLGMYLAGLI